jgi:hypothetical protein
MHNFIGNVLAGMRIRIMAYQIPYIHQTFCVLAEVVGSNHPTRSTIINPVEYGIELGSFE